MHRSACPLITPGRLKSQVEQQGAVDWLGYCFCVKFLARGGRAVANDVHIGSAR